MRLFPSNSEVDLYNNDRLPVQEESQPAANTKRIIAVDIGDARTLSRDISFPTVLTAIFGGVYMLLHNINESKDITVNYHTQYRDSKRR